LLQIDLATQLGLLCTTCGLQTIFPSSSFSADFPPNYSVNKALLPALGPSAFYSLVHEVQKSEHSQRIHINHKRNGLNPPPRAKLLLSMDKRAYNLEAPAADPTDGIVLQPDLEGSYENIAAGEDSLAADDDIVGGDDGEAPLAAAADDNIAEQDEAVSSAHDSSAPPANDSQASKENSFLGKSDEVAGTDSGVGSSSTVFLDDSGRGESSLVAEDESGLMETSLAATEELDPLSEDTEDEEKDEKYVQDTGVAIPFVTNRKNSPNCQAKENVSAQCFGSVLN